MSYELVIGCVGKPSAGKSSFLNAATDSNAKVGNYPFTTIEPNYGVTYYPAECPCLKYEKTALCKPRYGRCQDGTRYIPVKMLDVAGLVPGASEGKGLGNQFLDDLRHAHVLLHVVDVSGTTNEKGEETTGYDPINDVQWLKDEIHQWIYNNLWKRWSNIVRKQKTTKSLAETILHKKLSGYGTRLNIVRESLDRMGQKEPIALDSWDDSTVHLLVDTFMEVRFPMVLVLNKVDMSSSDNNINKICMKYPDMKMIPTSALAEIFLRKMRSQQYIAYREGQDNFETSDDNAELKPCDEKLRGRLEKLKDLVLFRYGSTGVQDTIKTAVELKKFIPVYPVKNLKSLSCDKAGGSVLRDCIMVPRGTQVREFAGILHPDLEKHYLYAEGINGTRLGETDVIDETNNIIKYTSAMVEGGDNSNKD
ncbi:Hypothetical 45.2 kDa GTP-binding protein [Heterostelium album PN500]|uniref:Hypothetical 45.2 kDa GTP-binding protein n=1 Tax=Heterostelium pallidum (strain ATCC 26659 / Pp 5 / PN500) TaxID=670386 RepID=D3AZ62_HETP5|nr:Hypothetical 45.2 kDa GTP-binding protein [Heterostelium album PN500]EFA85445.1 Hypothetical 45.2 kDa GTP-binding protein [Heterostelium album PN500]|eukprot:XP_020437554.1 Hypothetical 45.2 kDa GTP-binding protein [Heterostelium album PN500]